MKHFARMIIRDNEGRFLVIRNTKDGRNRYEFPGGKVDEGECFVHAAKREAFEEVGISVGETKTVIVRQIHIDGHDWTGTVYVAETWSGIAEIREPDKFDDLKWVTFNELTKLPQIPYLTLLPATEALIYNRGVSNPENTKHQILDTYKKKHWWEKLIQKGE